MVVPKEVKFDSVEHFRSSPEVRRKIKKILKTFPNKYDGKSHLIRCAIIKLYNNEFEVMK